MLVPVLRLLSALSLSSALVAAQWSSDAAVNLPLGEGAGSQVQPKVVSDGNGGTWVSWFGGSGFDVFVQHLDADGVEQFAHNGLLVADRGFSSTQDYGLAVSTSGDALLAFRDDAPGGTQVSAALVTAAGTLPWGASHVQLTNTTAFVAAPVIAAGPDGGAYVGWTEDTDTRVARLDAAGAQVWAGDTVIAPPTGGLSINDAHASGDGVIYSMARESGGFGSPRHLWVQRLDSSGAPQFGAGGLPIFDGGSLQFGNFPDFEPDDAGGGAFSWYDTAGAGLQCYVQRVSMAGIELYAHNGVAVSTDATQQRVSPDLAFDAAAGEITVAWTELDSIQSQRGVSAQRFDSAGTRLWGSSGKVLVPLGNDDMTHVRAAAVGSASLVAWSRVPGFGNGVLEASWLDAAGAVTAGAFDVASTPSGKSRLDEAATTGGDVVLVWSDDRAGTDDILGQNVQTDGTLGSGPQTWTDLRNGLAGTAGTPELTGTGTLVGGDPLAFTLTGGLPGAASFFVFGLSALNAPFKSGVLVPDPSLVVGLVLDGGGGLLLPAVWPLGVPGGIETFYQCWIVDAVGPSGFAASNGLKGTTP